MQLQRITNLWLFKSKPVSLHSHRSAPLHGLAITTIDYYRLGSIIIAMGSLHGSVFFGINQALISSMQVVPSVLLCAIIN
jgi:hypothetical protein